MAVFFWMGQLGCVPLFVDAAAGVANSLVIEEAEVRVASERQQLADAVLQEQGDRAALRARLGEPSACWSASDSDELCEWQIAEHDSSWSRLAETIPTQGSVNVLCSLPIDGSQRARRSCTVHPRASIGRQVPEERRRLSAREQAGITPHQERDERRRALDAGRQEAQETLGRARNLVELSRLVGAAPQSCAVRGPLVRCRWMLRYDETEGFRRLFLAMPQPDPSAQRYRLQCDLPRDGSDRAEGSCRSRVPFF